MSTMIIRYLDVKEVEIEIPKEMVEAWEKSDWEVSCRDIMHYMEQTNQVPKLALPYVYSSGTVVGMESENSFIDGLDMSFRD